MATIRSQSVQITAFGAPHRHFLHGSEPEGPSRPRDCVAASAVSAAQNPLICPLVEYFRETESAAGSNSASRESSLARAAAASCNRYQQPTGIEGFVDHTTALLSVDSTELSAKLPRFTLLVMSFLF